jgi:segregation and condensation protein A
VDLTVAGAATQRDDFFLVEVEHFQGPMDLLLHLIRTQDIDVFDIPISKITAQFVTAIHDLRSHDLDGAGEFLEMAATLVRIKAQMLLPRTLEEEDEDPRAELVRRLLEYEQIREICQRLSVGQADRARRFRKGYVPPRPRRPLAEVPLETTWEDVYAFALKIETPSASRRHRVAPQTVAMEDKVVLIIDTLRDATRVEFRRLLRGFHEKMHGVMTFLAGLELSRRRLLFLRQTRPFGELWIYRREEGPEQGEGEPKEPESIRETEGATEQ